MKAIAGNAVWLAVINLFLCPQVLAQQQQQQKMTGKITEIDTTKKSIVLSVNQPERITLPGGTTAQPNVILGKDRFIPYHFRMVNNVIVRFSKAPELKDEKGKPRKMTVAEIKKYRGDGRLPGYYGQISDIQKSQSVTVTFTEKKSEKKNGVDRDVQLILVNGFAPTLPVSDKADPKDKDK